MAMRAAAAQQLRRLSTRSAAYQRRQFDLLVPALQTYQRLHGHVAVPLRFTVPEKPGDQDWPQELLGMKLGTTLSRFLKACASAKKASRRQHLDDVKMQLQELGLPDVDDWKHFLWTEVTVAAMRTYRSLYGDLLVPVSFTVPKEDGKWPRVTWGYKLGYWARELRRGKSKLLSYQLEDLKALDFIWNAREGRWNKYFVPAMQRFEELHGHSKVPQSFVVPSDDPDWPPELAGYRLGQKVNNLRCGAPPGTEEWEELELIKKNWMLLEALHEIECSDDDDDDEQSSDDC